MNHIFISYQRSWEDKVVQISDRLIAEGIAVWRDNSGKETGIPFSVKWWDVVEEALYDALGTLIIKTDEWDKSSPCSREYDIILKNKIPVFVVSADDFENQDDLLSRIKKWYAEVVNKEENRIRAYLFGQGYRYKRNSRISRLLPSKLRLFEAFSRYREFKFMENFVTKTCVTKSNPDVSPVIDKFLKKAKRKILVEQVCRLSVGLLGVLALILVYTLVSLAPYINKSMEDSDHRGRSIGMIDAINTVGKYNPVDAMNMLTTGETAEYFDLSQVMFQLQSSMADYLDRKYPVAFYPSGSDAAEKIISEETASNSILRKDVGGQTVITVGEYEKALQMKCMPSADCYVADRNEVFIAYDNIVVAYDLDNAFQGIPLTYNFETINCLKFKDNLIYGITVSGNVVCWENPIQKKEENLKLESGLILKNGSAVYIEGEKIVLNRDGKKSYINTSIPLSTVLAVSHKENLIVVFSETEKKIIIADIEKQEISSNYKSEFNLNAMSFSIDDSILVGTSFEGFIRVNLNSGDISYLKDEGDLLFGITSYEDLFVVASYYGEVAEYDINLRQISPWMQANGCFAVPKQMAISKKHKCLFSSNRSGNALGGCGKVYLENGELGYLPIKPESGLVSNTSVTVSEEGDFVAYGFPNGRIDVYDVKTLNLLYQNRSVAENIISLQFGNDCLYGLGESGSVYKFNFNGQVRVVDSNTRDEYWKVYVDKSLDIQRAMYELGLSYIYVGSVK